MCNELKHFDYDPQKDNPHHEKWVIRGIVTLAFSVTALYYWRFGRDDASFPGDWGSMNDASAFDNKQTAETLMKNLRHHVDGSKFQDLHVVPFHKEKPNYKIVAHDTKEPLYVTEVQGGGISFAPIDSHEVKKFYNADAAADFLKTLNQHPLTKHHTLEAVLI